MVTLNVTTPAGPSIGSVHSSANFDGPITAGSQGTIKGTGFTAPVEVTFDGLRARILFHNNQQINLVVPPALAGRASTQMVVSLSGVAMAPVNVPLAPFSPAIFPGGGAVLNQNHTVNGADHPAPPGTTVHIVATGISPAGVVTVRIGGQPLMAESGPAPRSPGAQQVNVRIPAGTVPANYLLQICEAAGASAPVCSPPAWLIIGQ